MGSVLALRARDTLGAHHRPAARSHVHAERVVEGSDRLATRLLEIVVGVCGAEGGREVYDEGKRRKGGEWGSKRQHVRMGWGVTGLKRKIETVALHPL